MSTNWAAIWGVVVTAVLMGCGSSPKTSTTAPQSAGHPSPAGVRGGHGPVLVLYAGSLVNLLEFDLGPSFQRADGYSFQGVGAGSTELVQQIKARVRHGDVFISASPKANAGLEGAANGDYVRWYAAFARAPLVIGYDPHSRFAAQFAAKPWYEVITAPDLRLGRTDPKLDPKGKLTVQALARAAAQLHRPALARALAGFEVFPEEDLVGRLEAGQLDAGFFYASEAAEQHIPAVSLMPVSASATYTVSVLKGASNPRGAEAFVAYLLGPAGRATLKRHRLEVLASPKVAGSPDAVPAALRSLVSGA